MKTEQITTTIVNTIKPQTKKIPENAKCIFKGIRYDTYQWEQEQFDGTYKTFEAIKKHPTVQFIIVTEENKIILSKEEQPFIGKFVNIPGGFIEKNKNPIQTVQKELLEEFGLEAQEIKLWKKKLYTGEIQKEENYFIVKDIKQTQIPQPESGEKIEKLEVDFEQFLKETQKERFRNKHIAKEILRVVGNKKTLEEFKQLLFN